MIEYLTVTFFLEALFFLGIGIRVMAARRPLLLHTRWLLGFVAIAFSPAIVFWLNTSSESGNPIMLVNILVLFVVFVFLAIVIKGYIVMGITDESFRAAIHNALQALNITFEETIGHIKLTSHNLELQVAVQSWVGSAQLKMKGSNGKPVLNEIVKAVSRYYQTHETKTNNMTAIFYLVLGVLMLVMGIIFVRL